MKEVVYKETKLRNDFVEQQLKNAFESMARKDAKIKEMLANAEKFKDALRQVNGRFQGLEDQLEGNSCVATQRQ